MQCSVIYVTVSDQDEAQSIGRTLVEERLVACANVMGGMTSVYRWEDRVEQAQEAVLLLKTTTALVKRVMARVCELHSYEIPCIVSWTIDEGNPEFLQWIENETISAAPPPIA